MSNIAQFANATEGLLVNGADSMGGNGIGGRVVVERYDVKAGEPSMTSSTGGAPSESAASRRILLVEDEFLIRMLLEDMLDELGYGVAATAGRVDEATDIAKTGDYDLAILDVNLDGEDVYPVAEILSQRGVPFLFVTGYGGRGLPEPYRGRPTLQKPFQIEDLSRTLGSFFGTNG